jgi:AcrR family transcriptional regulator
MTPASAPTDRGQRRRAQLLAVAVDCLLDEGVDGFSLRLVARRAGTTHRLVSYHFGSEPQLLREALTEIRRPYLEQAGAASRDPLGFAKTLLRDASPASSVLLQGMLRAGTDPDTYGGIGQDYVDAYLHVIEALLPDGLTGRRRKDLAALVLCTFRGALLDARSTGSHQRAERALTLLRDLVTAAAGDRDGRARHHAG